MLEWGGVFQGSLCVNGHFLIVYVMIYFLWLVCMQFDFAKEDVPERDVSQVVQNIDHTRDILEALQEEMVRVVLKC